MSTEMTLFGGKQKALSLPGDYEDNLTKTIAGSSGGGRRISLRGSVFREIVGGKEVRVSEERIMNVVLINAAPVGRTYYEGKYDENVVVAPTCWSSDTQAPDESVPDDQKQATRCADCPNNIRGSGEGDTRACRFSQRVAVVLEGEIDKKEVYQLQLPARSVFGDAEGGKMPLQAYGRFLNAHNTHAITVVTQMKFDTNSSTPKLTFSAVRPLDEQELETVLELKDAPETQQAITMTVSETDGAAAKGAAGKVQATSKPAESKAPAKAKAKAKPKKEEPAEEPEVEEDEAEEEVEEPKKKSAKRAAPEPEPAEAGLGDLLDEWDD